jgi:hypothetical protein
VDESKTANHYQKDVIGIELTTQGRGWQEAETKTNGCSPRHIVSPACEPVKAGPVQRKHTGHYQWGARINRIYEVFPRLCPLCGGQMRLIVFITQNANFLRTLDHIWFDSEPPHISRSRGQPRQDDCDAPKSEGVEVTPNCDLVTQPPPVYKVDQRIKQ